MEFQHVCIFLLSLFVVFFVYIKLNDAAHRNTPDEVERDRAPRWTKAQVLETARRVAESPVDIRNALPQKTGRRYIVVGGSGFVGGWIVVHLLLRGEDPHKIRVLDIRPPARADLTTDDAALVDFRIVDITDAQAVKDAFAAPWKGGDNGEITVFHTAATIRFYERMVSLLPSSLRVNVNGVKNVLDAAREAGVSTFVFTSSASIAVQRTSPWLWPWEGFKGYNRKLLVQRIDDDDSLIPKEHGGFFSNYAYSKHMGELLVRYTDNSSSGKGPNKKVIRTGCIRPGNGIFGSGGDVVAGAYLVRKNNPTWIEHVVQNFAYVENCSLAHLCYEARLNELSPPGAPSTKNPSVGGQAFTICDPGPPPAYGDLYLALNALTDGRTTFPRMSPTMMLSIAHVIEALYLSRIFLQKSWFPILAYLVPKVGGDIVNLQPSMFPLVMPHLFFSCARAELPPSEGGLGYKGQWTTLEGLCKLVNLFEEEGAREERQKNGAEGSGGFGLVKAERSVGKVVDNIAKMESVSEKMLN